MAGIEDLLHAFKEKNRVSGKGALSVMLYVTRTAIRKGLPLDPKSLRTARQGQVKGLGKDAVQKILKDYGVDQVLAAEGGRTSRGSLGFMEKYVAFLNKQHEKGELDLAQAERWWVKQVGAYLAGKPFKLHIDPAKSIAYVVRDLLNQAEKRQGEGQGTMIEGALIQHLVGAKLSLAMPDKHIESHGFSVADEPSGRRGDFTIEDVVIHVTTAPTEALLRKCSDNLAANLRPVIVTTSAGVVSGHNLARPQGIEGRVDFFEIEQFIAMNIYEISKFARSKRQPTVVELINKYNGMVQTCETDYAMLQIKVD